MLADQAFRGAIVPRLWFRLVAFCKRYWKQTLLAILVVALIDAAPLAAAGFSAAAFLKATIALPAAYVVAFGGPRRTVQALVAMGVMAVLFLTLTVPQLNGDISGDMAVISFFVLALAITTPYLLPRRIRVQMPSDWRTLVRALWRSIVRRFVAAAGYRWTLTVARSWWLVMDVLTVAILGSLALGIAVWTGWIEPSAALYALLAAFDGIAGGIAMWYVGTRLGGPVTGFGAAVLWAACSVRLDYWAVPSVPPTPTALLPMIVALALALRGTGTLRKEWLGVALALVIVPMSTYWPLLALTTCLAIVFVFWSVGAVEEARWTLFPIVASGIYIWLAAAQQVAHELAVQTALYDPSQVLVACASGCDGGLPWEFFYPSAFGAAFSGLHATLLTATLHWGHDRFYSIAPGWAELGLAVIGALALWRAGRTRLLGVWLTAIGAGVLLALPSHYLGLTLPSFSRLLVAVAPGFEFGAQLALLSGFFVALLGGFGVGTFVGAGLRILVVPALLAIGVLLLDVVSLPVTGHPGASLAQMRAAIPPGTRPKVAFYPFLTQGFGPEYDGLVRAAHRAGEQLVNEGSAGDSPLADLSAPETLQRLRSSGAQYVMVSLSDYSRRREILSKAHVVMPLDQVEDSPAWLTPDPADLSGMYMVRAQADGTMLFAI